MGMGSGSGDGGGIGGGHRAPTVRVRSAGAARSSCPDRDPAPGFGPGSARWRRAVLPLDDAGMHHREDSNLRFRIWNPESWPLDDSGMTSAIARSLRISAGLPVAVIAAQPCRRGRTVRSGGVPRSRTWFYRLRGDGISAHACTPMWGKGELEGSATARWPLPRLDRGTPRKRSLLPCLKDRCIAPMLASRDGRGWTGMDTPGGVEPPAGRVAACPVRGTVRLRRGMAPPAGIAPALPDRQSGVLLLDHGSMKAAPPSGGNGARLPEDRVVAGVGIAPTCMAYEARLDLSPANPRCGQGPSPSIAPCGEAGDVGAGAWKMAAGRGCRRSGFGQSRENPFPARARLWGLPDLRRCWSERGAFLQQPNGGQDRDRTDGPPGANRMLFR